jgi:hypothetical protein
MPYHLEKIERLPCTNEKLKIFGRAHYCYINQIFGDQSVRSIIQEVITNPGKLVVEPSGPEFENSFHHVFKSGRTKASIVCSANHGYQDIEVDLNDTLCQSYSLMSYLQIPFDKTPSEDATIEQKRSKHMSMITMYRTILNNKVFIKTFNNDLIFEKNNELWQDTIDNTHEFNIIEKYKTGDKILKVIERVLNIWEKYGWMYFIQDGLCIPGSSAKRTRKRRTI